MAKGMHLTRRGEGSAYREGQGHIIRGLLELAKEDWLNPKSSR